MSDEIKKNLVFLAKNLTNLAEILLYLFQDDIISENEAEEIKTERTILEKNQKLLNLVQKKDWNAYRNRFLQILRETNNGHCAEKIERFQSASVEAKPKISKSAGQPKNVSGKENQKDSGIGSTVSKATATFTSHFPDGSKIQLNHFKSFEVINSGAFGLVMKAKHKESKIAFAIKITRKYFYREVDNLRQSIHPNIITFLNSWSEYRNEETVDLHDKFQDFDQMFCVQMELCNGRDLNSWILRFPSEKLEWDAKRICFQICLGVESLHSKNIIHRDLKPANILLLNKYIKGQEDLIVKIGDLGMSRETYQESKMSKRSFMTNCGTELYMSPEQELKLERYDHKVDIFPMGIIFYELLNSTLEKTEVKMSIRQADLPRIFMDSFTLEAKLIREMLGRDPRSRPMAKEVVRKLNDSWNIDPSIKNTIVQTTQTKGNETVKEQFPTPKMSDEKETKEIKKVEKNVNRAPERAATQIGKKDLEEKSFKEPQPVQLTKPVEKEMKVANKIKNTQNEIETIPLANQDKSEKVIHDYSSKEIVQELQNLIKEEKFAECARLAKTNDEELRTRTAKFNYAICLEKNGQLEECVNTLEELFVKRWAKENQQMSYCLTSLLEYWKNNETTFELLNREPTEFEIGTLLFYSYSRSGRDKNALAVGKQIFAGIYQLMGLLSLTPNSYYHLEVNGMHSFHGEPLILFHAGNQTNKIEFSRLSLSLSSFERLSADELKLDTVSFTRSGRPLQEVTVNEFLDLKNINRLELTCNDDKMNIMNIDLSGDVSLKYLSLSGVKVLDWKEASWNVHELKLWETPIVEKSKMKVKEMVTGYSRLDISCLPQTIQRLELRKTEVFASAGIKLPHLKYLTSWNMDDSSFLSHFCSVQLTHVHFDDIRKVNVDELPTSVTQIKFRNCGTKIVGERRKVSKLILDLLPFEEVDKLLSHFQTDNLVIQYYNEMAPDLLLELMKKGIKTIAVGGFNWEQKEDFQNVFSHVDRIAKYYLLEGGRGRGIEREEFDELFKL